MIHNPSKMVSTAAAAMLLVGGTASAKTFIDTFNANIDVSLPTSAAIGDTDSTGYVAGPANVTATIERINDSLPSVFFGVSAESTLASGVLSIDDGALSRSKFTLGYDYGVPQDFTAAGERIVIELIEADAGFTLDLSINGDTPVSINVDAAFIAGTGLDLNNSTTIEASEGPLKLVFELSAFGLAAQDVNSLEIVKTSNVDAVDLSIGSVYIVPTPAAGLGGLVAMAGLLGRRRR